MRRSELNKKNSTNSGARGREIGLLGQWNELTESVKEFPASTGIEIERRKRSTILQREGDSANVLHRAITTNTLQFIQVEKVAIVQQRIRLDGSRVLAIALVAHYWMAVLNQGPIFRHWILEINRDELKAFAMFIAENFHSTTDFTR